MHSVPLSRHPEVLWLPDRALLLQGPSEAGLEAAQVSVHPRQGQGEPEVWTVPGGFQGYQGWGYRAEGEASYHWTSTGKLQIG